MQHVDHATPTPARSAPPPASEQLPEHVILRMLQEQGLVMPSLDSRALVGLDRAICACARHSEAVCTLV